MKFHYPTLTLQILQDVDLALRLSAQNPTYFDPKEGCEYPPQVIEWLKKGKFVQNKANSGGPGGMSVEEAEEVALDAPETEAENLLKFLKTLKDNLPETNDKLAYVRASATLLDKIVAVQERALGLKRQRDFENTVLEVMSDVLEPAQRTVLIDRLKNVGI